MAACSAMTTLMASTSATGWGKAEPVLFASFDDILEQFHREVRQLKKG